MAVKILYLDRVVSTNDYLSGLLNQGHKRENMMLIADYQDAGKGQGDHQWHSLSGKNLLTSFLLFPAFLSASDQFNLSRVASLALIDTLKILGLTAWIKWPNDILVKRRKVAGILIENAITGKNISHTIIGIGLNLNQNQFPEFPLGATSLALETGRHFDRDEVANILRDALMDRYRKMEGGEFSNLEKNYLENLFLLNETGEFISGDEQFSGIIRGLGVSGELLVERKGANHSYGFQEIRYIL